MDMTQTAVCHGVGQPPWLPDGQWRDLDELAANMAGEAIDAWLGEWRRDALLLARPLSLKERLRAEKRPAKH